MLVWVLFEKAYAGSTFIAYQQPGCAKGPVVDVDVDGDACGCYAIPSDYPDGHACGCYALTSDYRGEYNFDYQIQGIALYNTAGSLPASASSKNLLLARGWLYLQFEEDQGLTFNLGHAFDLLSWGNLRDETCLWTAADISRKAVEENYLRT
ncbi:hypothetical protein SUGI_0551290 [Cryptomeria japonica]|nr:hypothetical protein SUGI_0551290 [Cryptomeria japonica]